MFTNKAKENTRQDKTDRTYSYLDESKFINEKRKNCILTMLIQAQNCCETFTTHLWLKYCTCICALLLIHLAITSQKRKFLRKSSQG